MRMYDLCSGLEGASAAMKERGWDVKSVETDPRFRPTIVADVRTLAPVPGLDLAWASPPCLEFSRESMPWCRTGAQPDMSIVDGCWRFIRESQPRFWAIENVLGAVRWFEPLLGPFTHHFGPFYLWSNLPPLDVPVRPFKERLASHQKAERARVPYALSLAVALTVEAQRSLWEAAA